MSTTIVRRLIKLLFHHHMRNTGLLFANIRHVLSREAFYCNALSGNSDYNICINSDMTVSCNCVDIDGSGHIGDLNSYTLEEIFSGKTATKFRKNLSKGIIPIRRCLKCRELKKIGRTDAKAYVSNYTTPKHAIMVENTVQCNLKCIHCPRKEILKTRKNLKMSLADIEKVAKNVKSNKIGVIHFFNLGEPFLSSAICEEIAILKQYNPNTEIYVSTNGLLLHQEKKIEAALMMDYIWISLDGTSDESVKAYQAGGNFEVAYKNMKELVRLRNARNQLKPVIEWKYVVFSWNDSEPEIEKAIELAREAKVDLLTFWPGEGSSAQVSSRFQNHEYFKKLGSESGSIRKIDFRK